MPDILIRGMCKLESGKSYRALFKELNGKFVIVVELVESYADREVEIYPVEELPPHGDLIDRDAILNAEKTKPIAKMMMFGGAYVIDLDVVRDAPVVIPTEKGETQ